MRNIEGPSNNVEEKCKDPFKYSDFFNINGLCATFSAHYIPKNSYVSEGLFEIFININIRNVKGFKDQKKARTLLSPFRGSDVFKTAKPKATVSANYIFNNP